MLIGMDRYEHIGPDLGGRVGDVKAARDLLTS